MKLKQIAISLSAAALVASAFSANAATYFGDENNLSWLPGQVNKASKEQSSTGSSTAIQSTSESKSFVEYGDENNLSWLPTPAKR